MHEAKLLAEEYRTAGGESGVPEVVRS
jgi:hypothetical protein